MLVADDAWTVLVNRLGALCLQYIAQLAVAATAGVDAVATDDGGGGPRSGAGGGGGKVEKGDAMDLDEGTASTSASSVGMEVRPGCTRVELPFSISFQYCVFLYSP